MKAATKPTPRLTSALAFRDAARQLLHIEGAVRIKDDGTKEQFWRSAGDGALFAYYWGADIGPPHDPDWPHMLGVWHVYRHGEIVPAPSYGAGGCKVLSVLWRANGDACLLQYRRGPWEEALMALAQRPA